MKVSWVTQPACKRLQMQWLHWSLFAMLPLHLHPLHPVVQVQLQQRGAMAVYQPLLDPQTEGLCVEL